MRNSKAYRAVGTLVCLIFTAFFMFPLAIMLVRSFSKGGPSNYVKVFDKYNLWNNFSTSMLVVGLSLVVSFAAYAFAKLEFRGKKLLYYTLLGGMMVPAAATIYPLYQIVKLLGLVSSPFSLILPYATGSRCFNLMILKNYYDAIPDEMIEAASIDGREQAALLRDGGHARGQARTGRGADADLPVLLERGAHGAHLHFRHQGAAPVRHPHPLCPDHLQPRLYPGGHVRGSGDLSGAHCGVLRLRREIAHRRSDRRRGEGLRKRPPNRADRGYSPHNRF